VDENALSSLRRDGTQVGNKMSLLPSIDFELASLDGHRRTRNKRRRFGFQDPLVTHESTSRETLATEMTTMKNLKSIITAISLLLFSAIALCAQTSPQSRRVTDPQVRVILQQLERSSTRFRTSLNSALVQSRIDQTRPENDINTFASGFKATIHQLRSHLGSHLEGVAAVESVLRQASLINEFMARNPLNRQVQSDWSVVRRELNGLALVYEVSWLWNRPGVQPTYLHGASSLSDVELNQLIQRLETGGASFRTSLTEAFDDTGYDHTSGEGNMNNALRGLKKETDQLRNQFDTKQPIVNYVASLVSGAKSIDAYMRGNALTERVQNDWLTLRADINRLADAYNLSQISRN